ncbi:MAG TPA: hypothetical protein DD714_06190 [Candidatus Omnitrophica bacterium]|nr:hypothetical protein [Candidatus Omnitrophota bacterium]
MNRAGFHEGVFQPFIQIRPLAQQEGAQEPGVLGSERPIDQLFNAMPQAVHGLDPPAPLMFAQPHQRVMRFHGEQRLNVMARQCRSPVKLARVPG